MSQELSELSKVVLFKISRSTRGTDYTGKFMAIEELEHVFGEDKRPDLDKAIAELKALNYLKELEESEDAYFLTPYGEAYLAQPKNNAAKTQKTEYQPNAMEEEILRSFHEKTRKGRHRDTPAGLIQDATRSHKDWNRSDVEEAVGILVYQKYLKEKSESHRFDPKVYNRSSKERAHTIKTIYIELTGKALMYLNNRDGRSSTAAVYDKSTPYSTRRQLEGVFEPAKNHISIGDNYIGRKTLDYLLVAKVPVRILTSTQKETNFDSALTDFESEYSSSIEIQRVDGVLHGRFIIVDDKYYLIDHSIKDFGSKPSAIIEITDPTVQAAYKKLFDDNWS